MKQGTTIQAATKWLGIIVGFMTITLGVIHMVGRNPTIKWPNNAKFLDDVNFATWRMALFSLAPKVFIDTWTPMVFGIWALLAHVPESGTFFTIVTEDFLNYGVRIFMLILALFANLAYNGGIGIIFSIFSLLCCVMCLFTAYRENDSASLEISMKVTTQNG